jgi:hypothetical protein
MTKVKTSSGIGRGDAGLCAWHATAPGDADQLLRGRQGQKPLTDQDFPAESSTNAVTATGAKRSLAQGADAAGASGPGLAPRPGPLALSSRSARAACRPRMATGRGRLQNTKASFTGPERGWELADPPGRELSLPTLVDQETRLVDRPQCPPDPSWPASSARSTMASPIRSFTDCPD